MSSQGFVASLLKTFSDAFQPIEDSLASADAFTTFLAQFGWALPASMDMNAIKNAFANVTQSLDTLKQDAQQASAGADTLAGDIASLVGALLGLTLATTGGGLPPPLNQQAFWDTFPEDLLEYLVYTYLANHQPLVFGGLRFLGVLSEDSIAANPATGQAAYVRHGVDWSRIVKDITQPTSLFPEVYGWGTTFLHTRFIHNLTALLQAFPIAAGAEHPSDGLLDIYYDSGSPVRSSIEVIFASPFIATESVSGPSAFFKIVLVVMPIPPRKSAAPDGFALFPLITGQASTQITLSDTVTLTLGGGFDLALLRAEIHPGQFNFSVVPPATNLSASAQLTAQPTAPWILLGDKNSTHLELGGVHTGLAANGPVDSLE